MKAKLIYILLATVLFSCQPPASSLKSKKATVNPLIGTWELQKGTIIKGGDTTVTDYTKGQRLIKIINESHFAFLRHDLEQGKDSSTAVFVAGGGSYQLEGDVYTEHLQFLNYREWEGNDFEFTVKIDGDTLIQEGIEKIEGLGVEQYNIERYLRTTE
ncbi:hypothetical protein [Reichenbachiella ulvae]|uniref:Lipocalin-like domain-containing protein n=1 Tax=Reichenbachiella ulvae TaxID=2980104 RepID=A0ABT3CYX0_9BACT|nr:hypothetical protein [Reichenbachiella ulvae]MCV9388896.1 hypothetical protein [Reichenbachiella ulvae]